MISPKILCYNLVIHHTLGIELYDFILFFPFNFDVEHFETAVVNP